MSNHGVECIFKAFVVHEEDFIGLSVSMQEALDLQTPLMDAKSKSSNKTNSTNSNFNPPARLQARFTQRNDKPTGVNNPKAVTN